MTDPNLDPDMAPVHHGPYGANVAMEKWAATRKLKYVKHANCLHWISRGRRCGYCRDAHGSRDWMDHVSAWKGDDGKRLLLCQPYQFGLGDCQTLIDACAKFNLKAYIAGRGWYGFGTIAIELYPKDQP